MTTPIKIQSDSDENAPKKLKPICGFWRRLFAYMIDSLILVSLGWVLGYFFEETLVSLSIYGRWLGLPILLAYFGVLNSSIGGGQTLGKRILGIRVVNGRGDPISIQKSFLRSFILVFPVIVNGSAYPFEWGQTLYTIIGSLAVFGLGPIIILLFLVNTRTRQSLHDWAVDSFVVEIKNLDPQSSQVLVSNWTPFHLRIMGAYGLVLIIGFGFAFHYFSNANIPNLNELRVLQNDLMNRNEILLANVSISIENSDKNEQNPNSNVTVKIHFRHRPDFNSNIKSLVELGNEIKQNYPFVREKSILHMVGNYGYDIGFGGFWMTWHKSMNAKEEGSIDS